ncbi:MAG: hypothetical protein GY699_01645, partial [Desulfobacteraceae bacterium]|nr:hypothetical protein [Desulfobacteraceae bacterium]
MNLHMVYKKYKNFVCLLAILVSFFSLFLHSSLVFADVAIDIRVSGVLFNGQTEVAYVATVNNCEDVVSARITAGEEDSVISISDAHQVPGFMHRREFQFSGKGVGMLQPEIILNFREGSPHGSQQTHNEVFQIDNNKPQLTYKDVSFVTIEDKQYLSIAAHASDDIDISYIGFSVTGLRASDLRDAGGVVNKAKKNAFASTDNIKKVYPSSDDQSEFSLTIPVSSTTDNIIATNNGVVLADITVVDASGNQKSISKIAFTGKDVTEKVLGFFVKQSKIVFNNLLQTCSIIPVVNYEFRGETPLPGLGSGVVYESSNTDFAQVTDGGVVYPLAPTENNDVFITVSYPGVASVNVPVIIDPTKELVGLKVGDITQSNPLILDSLNTWYPVPNVFGIFDDGSQSNIDTQFPLVWSSNENAAGIIQIKPEKGFLANAVVPEQAPAMFKVVLEDFPDIQATIPIVAIDAIPEISIDIPDSVKINSQLVVNAQATDDVAVVEVRFLLDDSIISTDHNFPYEMTMDIPSDYLNRTLHFKAVAVDSAGFSNTSLTKNVKVKDKLIADVPETLIDHPISMQRFIEGSPIRYQIAVPVDDYDGSNISYMTFFLDGEKQDDCYFGFIEEREVPKSGIEGKLGETETKLFEIWRLDRTLGQVSTKETSRAFYAKIFLKNGGQGTTDSRLIRIIENTEPKVEIISPTNGDNISVGQTLKINTSLSDDNLAIGLQASLFLNDEEIDQFFHQDDSEKFAGSFELQHISHVFSVPIAQEMLGKKLIFRIKAVDSMGGIAQTPELELFVRGDQPPDVAVTNPVEGAHVIAGLPLELRANAVDDVKMKSVEFYVNGKLVGADQTSPYNFSYKTISNIITEQVITIHAVAVDSMDQR